MNIWRERLRPEKGEGLISSLILVVGVLLPLLFLIPLFGRLEQARLVAEQAARDGVRAAVEAPSESAAQTAASDAVNRSQTNSLDQIQLTMQGNFARGNLLEATTIVRVPLTNLPLFGAIGTVTVHARATAPVDQYRSLAEGPP